MNAGTIWWNRIGKSMRLITDIANYVQNGHSLILRAEQPIPWRRAFNEAFELQLTRNAETRRLVRILWKPGQNPGKVILDKLCSVAIASAYWPGQSYGQYLASMPDLPLCDCIVWISGIRNKGDMQAWISFVSEYTRLSSHFRKHPVFIMECSGDASESQDIRQLTWSIEPQDCRVFCLETAGELQNTDHPQYQAELAIHIGGRNPEFCNALLSTGADLLTDPVRITQDVLHYGQDDQGHTFPPLTQQQIVSLAWEAGISLLFPIVEKYRLSVIKEHEAELGRHLPIRNSSGESVNDVHDLEIGTLDYLLKSTSTQVPAQQRKNVGKCHDARNLMAHLKVMPYDMVVALLKLPVV